MIRHIRLMSVRIIILLVVFALSVAVTLAINSGNGAVIHSVAQGTATTPSAGIINLPEAASTISRGVSGTPTPLLITGHTISGG
ncbi:MAG: hypothetical protein HQL03_02780 [Nitrospirae bacterium]|nr:hypothetical protein [Nitrospirota bacterium]MBF0590886.1 hypothetical protein [Nitrospirota bacterium]